jgi:hypothetical protein
MGSDTYRLINDLDDTIPALDKFERDYFLICAHVAAGCGIGQCFSLN